MHRSILAVWLVALVSCTKTAAHAEPPAPSAESASQPAMAGHHRPHDMPHRFDDAEAWAKHFDDPQRDAWQRPTAVIDALAPTPDAVVADIGAGTGYFTVHLARAVPDGRVIAIDIEPDMVRYVTERAATEGLTNVTAVRNEPGDPGLPEAVDLVFMCDVVHHIEDRPAFFAAMKSGLRANARVVIVDFRPDAPENTPGPPRRHRLSVDTLRDELAPAGLRLVMRDLETLPYQYIAVFEAAD